MNKPGLIEHDPWLEPFEPVIRSRMERAKALEKELCSETGSLSEFASGHLYFGLHRFKEHWVFREWAPNAKKIFLIGVFSSWDELPEWELKPVEEGKWELEIPLPKMKHGDLYRLSVHWDGGQGNRIPAWTNRVVQDSTRSSILE